MYVRDEGCFSYSEKLLITCLTVAGTGEFGGLKQGSTLPAIPKQLVTVTKTEIIQRVNYPFKNSLKDILHEARRSLTKAQSDTADKSTLPAGQTPLTASPCLSTALF